MLPPVGAATLDHQAPVGGAMHGPAAIGVRKPPGEERQDISDQAIPIAGSLDDRLEHVVVGDALGRHHR